MVLMFDDAQLLMMAMSYHHRYEHESEFEDEIPML